MDDSVNLQVCINMLIGTTNQSTSIPKCTSNPTDICLLGSGAFGSVYYLHPNNLKCSTYNDAIVIKINTFDKTSVEYILQEIYVLQLLQEKKVDNVLQILPIENGKFFYNKHYIYTVYKYINGSNIYDDLITLHSKPDIVNGIAITLIQTLKNIHDNNILHLDIKPQNIMLDKTKDPPTPIFVDFGFSDIITQFNDDQTVILKNGNYMRGTLDYKSYNLVTHGTYSKATDIYALGLTILKMYNINVKNNNKPIQPLVVYEKPVMIWPTNINTILNLDQENFIKTFFNNIDIECIQNFENLVTNIKDIIIPRTLVNIPFNPLSMIKMFSAKNIHIDSKTATQIIDDYNKIQIILVIAYLGIIDKNVGAKKLDEVEDARNFFAYLITEARIRKEQLKTLFSDDNYKLYHKFTIYKFVHLYNSIIPYHKLGSLTNNGFLYAKKINSKIRFDKLSNIKDIVLLDNLGVSKENLFKIAFEVMSDSTLEGGKRTSSKRKRPTKRKYIKRKTQKKRRKGRRRSRR